MLAACWAHSRRFYAIAMADKAPVAIEAVRCIGELYAIEAEIRGQTPAQRLAVRNARFRPLVEELHFWLSAKLTRLSASSRLAEAIRYALTRWGGLGRFLQDGWVELDNNAVERAIRPAAMLGCVNSVSLRCSCLSRTLKPSMKTFCYGLPGAMWCNSTQLSVPI